MTIEDIFIDCSFEQRKLNCSQIIRKVFDPNFGQCYFIDVNKSQVYQS